MKLLLMHIQWTIEFLESKSELKDPGILIDEHLKFSNHTAEKVNKANQITGLIRRTFVHLDMYNFNLLYKSLVRLHLEYGNIWSPFLKSDLMSDFSLRTVNIEQLVLFQTSINLVIMKDWKNYIYQLYLTGDSVVLW